MQPHVQGSAIPADFFKRTTAGPLRNGRNGLTGPQWEYPQEVCQGGGEERGGGELCREASGWEAAHQVLLNEPRTAQAAPLSDGHSCHQGGDPLYEAGVLRTRVSCVHASSHAASSGCASTSTSPAPAEGFEELTVKESSQQWAAISTSERTAREYLGTQAFFSDHNAPDLKGQPANITYFFRQHFKGISRAVPSERGIEEWGAQGY